MFVVYLFHVLPTRMIKLWRYIWFTHFLLLAGRRLPSMLHIIFKKNKKISLTPRGVRKCRPIRIPYSTVVFQKYWLWLARSKTRKKAGRPREGVLRFFFSCVRVLWYVFGLCVVRWVSCMLAFWLCIVVLAYCDNKYLFSFLSFSSLLLFLLLFCFLFCFFFLLHYCFGCCWAGAAVFLFFFSTIFLLYCWFWLLL